MYVPFLYFVHLFIMPENSSLEMALHHYCMLGASVHIFIIMASRHLNFEK